MKRWADNILVDAFYKTLAILIFAHVIFLIAGFFWGGYNSLLGIRMLWPHLETSIWGWILGIVGAVAIYGLIYIGDVLADGQDHES